MKSGRAIVYGLCGLVCLAVTLAPTTSVGAGRAPYDITDYFPLNEGDTRRWVGEAGVFVNSVVNGTVSLGGTYTAVDVVGSPYGSIYHNFYSVSPAGLYHYGYSDSTGSDSGLLDPPVLIPNGISSGWSQHFSGTLRNLAWDDIGTYEADVTFVGIESVTVPAGPFADCLRFHSVINGDQEETFYALGVGPVKVIPDPPGGVPSEMACARIGSNKYGYYDSKAYFPLHEGDRWVYDSAKTAFIEGSDWLWMHDVLCGLIRDDPSDPNSGWYWSRQNGGWNGSGVAAHGEASGSQWGSPLIVLNEESALGDEIDSATITSLGWTFLTATVQGIEEDVTVPAGTFHHCLRVGLHWTIGVVQHDETWWLAPDVGRVKTTGEGELIAAIVGGTVYPACPLDASLPGMWDLANLEVDVGGTWETAPSPGDWQHSNMALSEDRRGVQRAPTGAWTKMIVCADPGTHKASMATMDASDPSVVGQLTADIDYTVDASQWVMTYIDPGSAQTLRATWTRLPCGTDANLLGLWRLTQRRINGSPQASPDLGAIHENYADGTWRRDYPWGGWERGSACANGSDISVTFLASHNSSEVGLVLSGTYSIAGDQWTMTYEIEGNTWQDTLTRVTCQQDPAIVGTWRLVGGSPAPDPEEMGSILMLNADAGGRLTQLSQDWQTFVWCASSGQGFATMADSSSPDEIGRRTVFNYALGGGQLTVTTWHDAETITQVFEPVTCDDSPEAVGTWTLVSDAWDGWPEYPGEGARTLQVSGPDGHTWRIDSADGSWMEGTACYGTTTHAGYLQVTASSDPSDVGDVYPGTLETLGGIMSIRGNYHGTDTVQIFHSSTCSHDSNATGIWEEQGGDQATLVIDADGMTHSGHPNGYWTVGPTCMSAGNLVMGCSFSSYVEEIGALYAGTYNIVGDTLTITLQTEGGPVVKTYHRGTCGTDAQLAGQWTLTAEEVNGIPQFGNVGGILDLTAEGGYHHDYPSHDWEDGTWCLDGGQGFLRIETAYAGTLQTGGVVLPASYDVVGNSATLDYYRILWGQADHVVRTYERAGIPGDFDHDEDVDLDDLSLFRPYWKAENPSGPPGPPGSKATSCRDFDSTYDLNQDDVIDFEDFIAFWRDNAPYHSRWIAGDVTGMSPEGGCPNQGYPAAGPDDILDFFDLMAFAGKWQTTMWGSEDWDDVFDFADSSGQAPPGSPPCPMDGVVDFWDLMVLAGNWLAGDGPCQPLGVKGVAAAPQLPDLSIGSLSVTTGAQACLPGDEVEVTVELRDPKGVVGYDVNLLYEPSKLALVEDSVHPGEAMQGGGSELLRIDHTNVPGIAAFSGVLAGRQPKGLSGGGTIATLRFTALEPSDEPAIRVEKALLANEARQVGRPQVAVTPLRIGRLGENDWRAEIVARAAGLSPASRFFGVIEDEGLRQGLATRGAESNPSLDVRFLTADGTTAADYRGPGDALPSFRFVVNSDLPNAEVALAVPDLQLLPKRYVLRLTDEAAGASVHLRTRNTYRFNTGADGTTRTFRLDVVDAQSGALRISEVAAAPVRGGGVALQYRLSADATVSIEVINVAGRRVRRLESGDLRVAGPQTTTWDGRSDAGTTAPDGTYVIRIRAAAEDGQKASAIAALSLHR